MLVLALDSSTRTGSIALARDGVLVDVCEGDAGRRHAERLPGELVTLLAAHDCDLRDVTLLAVTAGPGGFTGLRVGLATIQGLALALDRRVFVASTLDLLARAGAEAAADARWVGAWMQGMRGEVFTELHERLSDGRMRRVLDAAVGTPDSAATAWADVAADGTLAVIGDGWPTHGDALRPVGAAGAAGCAVLWTVTDAGTPAPVPGFAATEVWRFNQTQVMRSVRDRS